MDFLVKTRTALVLGSLALMACLANSPQEEDPRVQGDFEEGDEEHRPGQPCLLCHGPDHFPEAPGEEIFALAGTIYPDIDSSAKDGISDVEVIVTDANGEIYEGKSNDAGNFMFEVDGDLDAPRQKKKGVLKIPRKLVYPLEVVIRQGDLERRMETKIWRQGSCSHCHGETLGVASVGRVNLFDEVQP